MQTWSSDREVEKVKPMAKRETGGITKTRTTRTGRGRDTETAPVAGNGADPVLSALPEPAAEGNNAVIDNPPEHLARCAECDFDVRFRSLPSGAGFAIIGTELTLGIGKNGRPICPRGHGEMAIADDQIPAADAIAQVADQLAAAEQQPLFEQPPFNSAGAYLELEGMAVEADRLHRIWEGDAKTAKESKQAAEEASRRHVTASLEFRRRRLLKRDVVEDSAPQIATADLWDAVAQAGQILLPGTIEAWSDEERAAVAGWTTMPERERPSVLGTPHIAADTVTSEAAPGDTFVCCATCGARLSSTPTAGEDSIKMYPPGAKVGTDCPGPDVAHHYPERKKRRRASAEAASPVDEPIDADDASAPAGDVEASS